MKIPSRRFGWLEYFIEDHSFIRVYRYVYGLPFLHSRAIAHFLTRSVDFSDRDTVLDVGTGDGIFANWIAYYAHCTVHGVDRLLARITTARATAKKYNLGSIFTVLDVEERVLPLQNEAYNKILLIDILDLLRDPKKFLIKIFPLLKPSGLIFITVPRFPQQRLLWRGYKGRCDYGGKDHRYADGFSEVSIKTILKEAGFANVSIFQTYFGLYQLAWELSEALRDFALLHMLAFPVFMLFAALDRFTSITGNGNGLVVIARKL